MGIGILVLGESGSGKTCSLRNFTNGEVSIINVNGKPLPFKNDLKKIIKTDNVKQIIGLLQKTTSKTVVIDDSQYIMANAYMRSVMIKGYDKFTLIGKEFWELIHAVESLPADRLVYFLHHTEINEFGQVKAKTQGKLLDNHICLEGLFTIVLRTIVNEGYWFSTQNSGSDTVKTPMGMFSEKLIENDLKKVDEKIREFYNLF